MKNIKIIEEITDRNKLITQKFQDTRYIIEMHK